jgi:hypothetical protein
MKKMFTLLVIVISVNANAQITKDSLLKVMSSEACEELSKKDLSKVDPKNLESEIGMLLSPTMMSHLDDIERIYGGGMQDQDAMKKMGMDLGMRLATSCPKFIEISMQAANGDEKIKKAIENKMKSKKEMMGNEASSINGTLLSVNPGDIVTLTLSDSKGKITKFYWLESFENGDIFIANNKKHIGKKVTINYIEKSVYDFVKKGYKKIKVITGINLK